MHVKTKVNLPQRSFQQLRLPLSADLLLGTDSSRRQTRLQNPRMVPCTGYCVPCEVDAVDEKGPPAGVLHLVSWSQKSFLSPRVPRWVIRHPGSAE